MSAQRENTFALFCKLVKIYKNKWVKLVNERQHTFDRSMPVKACTEGGSWPTSFVTSLDSLLPPELSSLIMTISFVLARGAAISAAIYDSEENKKALNKTIKMLATYHRARVAMVRELA